MLIADDHKIIRDGIKMVLGSIGNQRFRVHEADSFESAVVLLAEKKIDVAFVDYRMGDRTGDELVSFLNSLYPSVKAVGISNYDESAYVAKMIKAGAKGYVLKNVGVNELQDCIDKVLAGSFYYSKEVLNSYLESPKQKTQKATVSTDFKVASLTKREIEIIKLIAQEYTNEEIAETLGLAKRTVDNQRNNLMQRINVRNTAGLIKFAFQHGLID